MKLAIILILVGSIAATRPASAEEVSKIEKLLAKAERTDEHKRGKIYADLVHELVERADNQYRSNQFPQAEATMLEIVLYAEMAANSAKMKGKDIKKTEIKLRKASNKLEDMQRSLPTQDQGPVKNAVERISELRTSLLEHMFRKKD